MIHVVEDAPGRRSSRIDVAQDVNFVGYGYKDWRHPSISRTRSNT